MNAIELLKKDHRTVESLFKSFEKAKEKDERASKAELFASIKDELDAHARVEEEIFYPAFDGAAEEEDDKELVLEAGEEHKQVKSLLAELAALDPADESFDAKMKVLKDNVEHHVEEEEGEMFPHAQKELGSDRLEELGSQIAARKEQIQKQGAVPAGRSAQSSAPPSRARASAPRRRSGRRADERAAGADVARGSGSSEAKPAGARRTSAGGRARSSRSSGGSSPRTRPSSSGRTASGASRGRSSSSGRRSATGRGSSSGRRASSSRRGTSSRGR